MYSPAAWTTASLLAFDQADEAVLRAGRAQGGVHRNRQHAVEVKRFAQFDLDTAQHRQALMVSSSVCSTQTRSVTSVATAIAPIT